MPVGAAAAAARSHSTSSYHDQQRAAQTIDHRGGPDPAEFDHQASATMFPSSRFATQSALAAQLMAPSHQRPPLHISVQSPSASQQQQQRGAPPPAHDPYAVRATPYPQMAYAPSPHPGHYSSASSSRDLAGRSRQGSYTPQPQRTTFDPRPSGSAGPPQPSASARNLQTMRSNPNFRGGMPLPGQNRPRPPMPPQQLSGGSLAREQDSLYASGVRGGGQGQAAGRRPSVSAEQMYPPGVAGGHMSSSPAPPPQPSLSPPIMQGGFAGHPGGYPYDRIAPPPPISTYSRNPSPNRSPLLPMGPNSPRSPGAEFRALSPRPSTMFDAGGGQQGASHPNLPRRPSSHYDASSAPHDTVSFHAPVVPLARSPNQDFPVAQQGPFPSLPPQSAGPRSAVEARESLIRGAAPLAGHGRFATEGASPPLPTVDLAPPPPYMPSPELQSSSPVVPQQMQQPSNIDALPAHDSPNLARNSAYGGLFDYMVNDTAPAEEHSPNSTATGDGTEIGYRMEPPVDAPSSYDDHRVGDDDSDESDDDDDETGTNALFLPQRPLVATPSVEGAPTSSTTSSSTAVNADSSAPAADDDDDDAEADDGHDAGNATFTAQMRYLRLDDGGGDTFLSDESTLGPSGRLSNRSLPPIDTSAQAPPPSSSSHPSTAQEPAHSSRPLSSASPDWDTPDSGGGAGGEQRLSAGNLRRKKTVFEKNEDKQWAFRPPAEQVVRELSKFFPEINLEAEFIEADASPAATPPLFATSSAAAAAAAAAAPPSSTREAKLRNRKSIRRVAEERQSSDRPSTGTLVPTSLLKPPAEDVKVVRRRSTRMWGGKVEEVKPSALKDQLAAAAQDGAEGHRQSRRSRSSLCCLGSQADRPPALASLTVTFKWVKGDLIGKGAVRPRSALSAPLPLPRLTLLFPPSAAVWPRLPRPQRDNGRDARGQAGRGPEHHVGPRRRPPVAGDCRPPVRDPAAQGPRPPQRRPVPRL